MRRYSTILTTDERAGQPSTGPLPTELPRANAWRYVAFALFFVLALTCCRLAVAEAPNLPPCRPGQTAMPAGTPSEVCFDFTNLAMAEVWFCDAKLDPASPTGYVQDGRWYRYGYGQALGGLTNTARNALERAYLTARQAVLTETDDQLKARWLATVNQATDICDPANADYAACPIYHSCGQPKFYAPSGLRTHAEWPEAYKQTQQVNGWAWTVIGTVPPDLPCDTAHKVGDYFLVDRAKVKRASVFSPLPTAAYARCQ